MSMLAAFIAGPGRAELREVAVPQPRRGQLRLRIQGCGVCGSSLPLWQGRPWLSYPCEPGGPGHEAWGIVDAVGDGVPESLVSQRVCALSYHGYAEYDLAEAAQVVPLPAALGEQPFPGEALGCAMNIWRRAQVRPGEHVAVVGAGFLGTLLIQLAARAGALPVAISRRPFALQLAASAGAKLALSSDDQGHVLQQIHELTGGRGCEVVIEATGEQQPLDLATKLTRERGRLVIAGYHQDPRSVDMQQWNWRGLDVINAHEREPAAYVRGMREAVSAVVEGRLDPAPLYTHSFKLSELGEALDGLSQRPDGMLKTWVTP